MSERAKCGWELRACCRHSHITGVCLGGPDKCEHRVTDAPAKVPTLTCPKCKKTLDYSPINKNWCCYHDCDWSQPDAEQRPPMPEPSDGHHATEYRVAVKGIDAWYSSNGVSVYTPNQYHHDQPIKVWIAVKDAQEVKPVVRYVAWIGSGTGAGGDVDRFKLCDGIAIDCKDSAGERDRESCLDWFNEYHRKVESHFWMEITAAEYEAAKTPAKPAAIEPKAVRIIEPLKPDSWERRVRMDDAYDKINELVARVNEIGGGK